MTTVADMVAEWLREHGYDGLTNGDDCACLATDDSCPLFAWCLTGSEQSSGAGSVMCVPGHKVMRGSEWDIVPDERHRLDAMLAVSVPDLLEEVERLRGIVQWREALADVADDLRAELGESHKALKNCDAEVVRLRARNVELVAVLRSVEWEPIYFTDEATTEDEPEICTRCHRRRTDGHAPDCALDAALRNAHD